MLAEGTHKNLLILAMYRIVHEDPQVTRVVCSQEAEPDAGTNTRQPATPSLPLRCARASQGRQRCRVHEAARSKHSGRHDLHVLSDTRRILRRRGVSVLTLVPHEVHGPHVLDQRRAMFRPPAGNGAELLNTFARPPFIASTGQRPTRALSIPKSSPPPRHLAKGTVAYSLRSFIIARTELGSNVRADWAADFQSSKVDAYSQETALQVPGKRLQNSA